MPTHVQVTVHRARNLISKGRGDTNNAFVTMQLGKDKFQTSVAKEQRNPQWGEECELTLLGMNGVIVLNVYHKSTLVEDFLGRLDLPLSNFNRYDPPRAEWYKLKAKPGKPNRKDRGEIEVEIGFIAKTKEESPIVGRKSHKLLRSVTEAVGAVRSSIHVKTRSNSAGNFGHKESSNINVSVEDILKELGEDEDIDDDDISNPSKASGSVTPLEQSGSYSGGSPKQQERRLSADSHGGSRKQSRHSASAGSSPVSSRLGRSISVPENENLSNGVVCGQNLLNGVACGHPPIANSSSSILREPKPESKVEKQKRRHSISSMTGSILNFATSKLRGESSAKHSIDEETGDEYESLNHQELLKVAIQQRECLKQKENELVETKRYVDELVLILMEKAPHLLEQGNPGISRDPSTRNGFTGTGKSARKRPAWHM